MRAAVGRPPLRRDTRPPPGPILYIYAPAPHPPNTPIRPTPPRRTPHFPQPYPLNHTKNRPLPSKKKKIKKSLHHINTMMYYYRQTQITPNPARLICRIRTEIGGFWGNRGSLIPLNSILLRRREAKWAGNLNLALNREPPAKTGTDGVGQAVLMGILTLTITLLTTFFPKERSPV